MNAVTFVFENIEPIPLDEEKIGSWINQTIQQEKHKLLSITIILCSDDYLLGINKNYLNHDYYTDIITFDNSDSDEEIEADLFISLERVKENAVIEKTGLMNELLRVCVHGILHLCGYDDKTTEQRKLMRSKENAYLSLHFK